MMSRRRPWIVAALLALVASGALPAAAGAHSFDVTCTSSHVSSDDPIVFPGQVGAAHRHEFFGARTTDAHSTTASLERSATSCVHRRDTAAYWVPTLEVRGTRVVGTMRAYYQRAGKARAAAPPRGLRVIAGDPRATTPQARTVTTWQCIGRGRTTQYRELPTCVRGERLAAWIRFPDCWNGRMLDSPDHRAHLAASRRGRCPGSHPVELMRLALLVSWPVRPAGAARVTLGDGRLPATGLHADFWNAWHMPTLRQLRWSCIEVAAPCGAIRWPRR